MAGNEENLQFNPDVDFCLQGHLKLDQEDSIEQDVPSLISVKREELDHDSFQFTDTLGVVKEEYMLGEAVETETEYKPLLLEDFDSVEGAVKTDEIGIKLEDGEEEDTQGSSSSSHPTRNKYDKFVDTNHCFDGPRRNRLLKSDKKKAVHKCKFCNYSTDRKNNIEQHLVIHKDPGELHWFLCDFCDYKTIRKHHIKVHLVSHKNPEETDWFQCQFCDYKSIRKQNFQEHVLRHKNPEDFFRCDLCDFKTVRKDKLKSHLLKHTSPENWFRCDRCEYRTYRKDILTAHVLRHNNLKEGIMFKCEKCTYQTVHSRYLKSHIRRHKH